MSAGGAGDECSRFQSLVAELVGPENRRYALARVADYLRVLEPEAFRRAVADAPRAAVDAATLNHLAGAIELAAERRGQAPPRWTAEVPPAPEPTFASALASVRLHLLTRTPVVLRRRNIFADASFDERV